MAARQQECSICMDSFKNPKLISCHHSFCLNCLDDYVRANLRNGRFNCPICRTSVELPKGGVLGFQSNFYIDDSVSGEKFACDLCGPKNVACSRCLDCEENLCQTCCYGHEKSKASRHHKISDLGTLDRATKGKIRQRIFCDQHPEDEIRLFCRDCKVLICLMCKAVNHENHTSRTVADYAAEMKKTLQSKKDECSDKLKRMNDSKTMAEELDRNINDVEREEIKAVEEQHLQLKKVIKQEVANVKGRIKIVYHDLRQQIAVFKKCVEDECVTCYNAQENVQKLTDQGTDIDIIRNGPNLEQLISASISKTDPTQTTGLKNKLFSPASIDASKLIPLIGIMQDSTDTNAKETAYSWGEKNVAQASNLRGTKSRFRNKWGEKNVAQASNLRGTKSRFRNKTSYSNSANWEGNSANWEENSANWEENSANWEENSANWEENSANWEETEVVWS